MTDIEIRVLLVDDDPLVRAGLKVMLDGHTIAAAGEGPERRIRIVGDAGDGDEVPDAVRAGRPHVVLMDLRMRRVNGVSATQLLTAEPDPPTVVVLTTFDADEHVVRALRAGASGFLLKDADAVLSPAITRRLIGIVAGGAGPVDRRRGARTRLDRLAERERDVAEAVARGGSNADIAEELHMSVSTVKSYVSKLLRELGLDNRVQIALLVRDATD
ncbi:putative two-component system response regulator [Pseudonocardia sp. Ae168_Ps1]|uniref:response regulator n=1 Tax=unclassified Pseudonocardia TaxID=2619320 RepID=UPI00094B48DD|nr:MULTISPECIES: response regulator transcription factor [unclassified Pseudonocardia]OLL72826.1 putative two-component system response regulator [Pseudonocardia sp. Ae150A_Ps1]OLL78801.1 putative two-component system response regulator [Pseudonocardia sp. Ae168_Ps1]OLL87073.1 putative two-component system response regulator [Pseudonocardia sp. Ae263_Ps1]OLL92896.1 putative two-component system response regulator [Pseudonocardia sp. Ae356_Ps1]